MTRGENAHGAWTEGAEEIEAALEKDPRLLPPETPRRENVTPGGSCELHAQELPRAPADQVSCCLEK